MENVTAVLAAVALLLLHMRVDISVCNTRTCHIHEFGIYPKWFGSGSAIVREWIGSFWSGAGVVLEWFGSGSEVVLVCWECSGMVREWFGNCLGGVLVCWDWI